MAKITNFHYPAFMTELQNRQGLPGQNLDFGRRRVTNSLVVYIMPVKFYATVEYFGFSIKNKKSLLNSKDFSLRNLRVNSYLKNAEKHN